MGCAANPNIRVRRTSDGRLQVDGPLAGPFPDTETLAAHACELMTGQGGASAGMAGSEYCALHYYAPDEQAYYLSYLSDVKRQFDTTAQKTCEMPGTVNDPARRTVIILGGDHTHPHNRRFSRVDLSGRWYPARAVDKKTGQVFERDLYLFFKEGTGECRAYRFNYATREILALREGRWVVIGRVVNDEGRIEMLDGKDWLP
ncbi:hypothetical protein D7V97_38295 [Corallococcus sp. CA053C]|nr:hypothetical protein D7V97_38295 [Corallococcus sp. CA053C]